MFKVRFIHVAVVVALGASLAVMIHELLAQVVQALSI